MTVGKVICGGEIPLGVVVPLKVDEDGPDRAVLAGCGRVCGCRGVEMAAVRGNGDDDG